MLGVRMRSAWLVTLLLAVYVFTAFASPLVIVVRGGNIQYSANGTLIYNGSGGEIQVPAPPPSWNYTGWMASVYPSGPGKIYYNVFCVYESKCSDAYFYVMNPDTGQYISLITLTPGQTYNGTVDVPTNLSVVFVGIMSQDMGSGAGPYYILLPNSSVTVINATAISSEPLFLIMWYLLPVAPVIAAGLRRRSALGGIGMVAMALILWVPSHAFIQEPLPTVLTSIEVAIGILLFVAGER